MKIALIQTHLYWENKEKNLVHFENIMNGNTINNADVIVLPEMFTTGFTMNSSVFAEKIGGETTQWMLQKAKDLNACIVGSFITTNNGNYYNTLLWAYPNGQYQVYHKRHLFRMAQENLHYSAGNHKIICEYKGYKFLPLICYDLRFPVWSRNQFNTPYKYDVLIYVANWPKPRIEAWKKLLYARAIENLSYAVGVNRIGTDGKMIEYNGQSITIDFKGEEIINLDNKDSVQIVQFDKKELDLFREKFPAYLDADYFEIK